MPQKPIPSESSNADNNVKDTIHGNQMQRERSIGDSAAVVPSLRGDATSWAVMARGREAAARREAKTARASELVAASRSRRQAQQEQLGRLQDQATNTVRDGEAAAEPSSAKGSISKEGAKEQVVGALLVDLDKTMSLREEGDAGVPGGGASVISSAEREEESNTLPTVAAATLTTAATEVAFFSATSNPTDKDFIAEGDIGQD